MPSLGVRSPWNMTPTNAHEKTRNLEIIKMMTEKWATEQSCIHIEIPSCKIPSLGNLKNKCEIFFQILWTSNNI